jgi:hypothetical protein
MVADSLASLTARRIPPEAIGALDQRELMDIVACAWGDVELASTLHLYQHFLWKHLEVYGQRGYLTAWEDQEVRRVLALQCRPELLTWQDRAVHSAGATEPPIDDDQEEPGG